MRDLLGTGRIWFGFLIVVVVGAALFIGVRRERRVVPEVRSQALLPLEDAVMRNPSDVTAVVLLADAYVDAGKPGLAVHLIERSPESVRMSPRADHSYSRALIGQGRNAEALDATSRVLSACQRALAIRDDATCDTSLYASATHRHRVVLELLRAGVEDTERSPERAAEAVRSATRSVRIAPSGP